MRVLIQLRTSPGRHDAAVKGATASAMGLDVHTGVPGVTLDPDFPVVQVPGVGPATGGHLFSLHQPLEFSMEPAASTYLVRGTIPDDTRSSAFAAALAHPDVVGVFADPAIESCPVCPGDPAVGRDTDVSNLLNVGMLWSKGMDGSKVYLAVVDTGVNVNYLRGKGRKPHLDVASSFTPAGVTTKPGAHPVDHGTMCAYDAGITAPEANLLDCAVLLSKAHGATVMSGLLSDAVLAYSRLRATLQSMPAPDRAMVITNSWGMFSPKWDFPPGHPGNYSDNPAHPFNVIVASLEQQGADILFAAGNCGRDCPDSRCGFGGSHPICGANSHPSVLSVAGVDTEKRRVGYSSQGPGRLDVKKPDISGYTHFAGSGVYPEDGGTSAACPVVAGVVAAIRSKHRTASLSPAQLRALIFKSAIDLGKKGFDYNTGWGIINPEQLLTLLP